LIALLRFHLASGARLALAAAVPIAGATVIGIGLQPYPAKTVERLVTLIAGWPPSLDALVGMSALAFGLALWAVPRVALGSDGWIRHLPSSRRQRGIALVLATAIAEAPLVVAALGCAALESWRTGEIAWRGFLIPPFVAMTTSALAVGLRPGRRGRARLGWFRPPGPFELRIALRALGARVVGGWLFGAVPLGAAFLFVRNNHLPSQLAGYGTRLGGALAVTLALALLADALAIRRPSWPWARSLPEAAARRVACDAVFLGALCAPLAVILSAFAPLAVTAVLALIPLLSLRAAAAMRRGGERRSAASGPVLIEGSFASALIALVPWLAVVALAAVPFAFRAAVNRERLLKVTRWSALHHVAAGDTLSWNA
jgi:hypothetical protein